MCLITDTARTLTGFNRWFAITETCLAITIFREELRFRFVSLFTVLLFVKIFHWLSQFRYTCLLASSNLTTLNPHPLLLYSLPSPQCTLPTLLSKPSCPQLNVLRRRVEQFPTEINITSATHARIVALMSCLMLVDVGFLAWHTRTMMAEGPSFLILFTFEYVILASSMVTTFCKVCAPPCEVLAESPAPLK